MRGRTWFVGALAMTAALFAAATAQATIVYTQSHQVSTAGGNLTVTDIYAMNDDGSNQHVLVAATNVPPNYTLEAPNVLPNGSTVAFSAMDDEYCTNALGGCGSNADGTYTLSNGVVARISPAIQDVEGFDSSDDPSKLTADGRVISDEAGVSFSGNPPMATNEVEAYTVRPLSPPGQTASTWTTAPDTVGGSSISGVFVPDPVDGSLMAYFTDYGGTPADTLFITNQAGSNPSPIDVVADPGQKALAWSPDASEFAVVDEIDTADNSTDQGFSAGLWTFPATANAQSQIREVLADPNPSAKGGSSYTGGTFGPSIAFAGPGELVFAATYQNATNLWEVPTTCTAATCTFPASAKQLTTAGTDGDPTWTSQTLPVFGNPLTLTVATAGSGSGSVSSSPAGITCGATCSATYSGGTVVTLTATAASGSTFRGWSGGGCGGTGTCAVTLNSATTVTATFNSNPGPPGAPPAITHLSLTKGKVSARKGFTLKVTLATAGQLDIKVYLVRHHKAPELLGLVTEHGKTGANKFTFKRVGHHKLKAGKYTLTVYTVIGKTDSAARHLKVTLTR